MIKPVFKQVVAVVAQVGALLKITTFEHDLEAANELAYVGRCRISLFLELV